MYWIQWNHTELMSMQGVELDEIDTNLKQNECVTDLCHDDDLQEAGCCSGGCMDCLGLSWKDFM